MHIDILNSNYKMKHIIKPNETIILNAVGSVLNIRHLLNWAVLSLLFLSKLPNQNTCIFSSLKNKSKLYTFNIINFWYQMFFRNEKACLHYLTSINLILIVLIMITPRIGIVNAGPTPSNRQTPEDIL